MKTFFSMILLTGSVFAFNPEGYWFTPNHDAKVHITKRGEKLFGKIVDLKEKCRDGKPKVDVETNQPTIGLEIVKDFEPDGENRWAKGTVRDPKEGKTYSGTIEMPNDNQLHLRGFVGIEMFGRTSEWSRANEHAQIPGSENDTSCSAQVKAKL